LTKSLKKFNAFSHSWLPMLPCEVDEADFSPNY